MREHDALGTPELAARKDDGGERLRSALPGCQHARGQQAGRDKGPHFRQSTHFSENVF